MIEIPKCNTCGQPMFEIGGIGKDVQIGEFRKSINIANLEGVTVDFNKWYQTGAREQKLYQCPKDKDVKIY